MQQEKLGKRVAVALYN